MRINTSAYSIGEIRDMLKRNELRVNDQYQRNPGLWPKSAQSYFIDTILEGFTFHKLYFHEKLDIKTQKIHREIVDGQQRVMTIQSFLEGKLKLSKVSEKYAGLKFEDLDSEKKSEFLSYTIQVDIVRQASKSQILEMFRRMNSYTLPLNDAEKRNSIFAGDFKWAMIGLCEKYGERFNEFGVFTERQVLRFADADFFADCVVALESGIVNTTEKVFEQIYDKYDEEYSEAKKRSHQRRISQSLDRIFNVLSAHKETYLFKPYVLHSIFCAMRQNKAGLNNWKTVEALKDLEPIGSFMSDTKKAVSSLLKLEEAHRSGDENGEFKDYVRACAAGSNRAQFRSQRIKWLALALRGKL